MSKDILFYDDFSSGLLTGKENRKWSELKLGMIKANDADISVEDGMLKAVSKGKNPVTGEPAFTKTSGQGMAGQSDHMKWSFGLHHKTDKGKTGFDTVSGKKLVFEAVLGGRTYGTNNHPFKDAIKDPEADPRFGSPVMLVQDADNMTIYDFFLTNHKIYAVYERGSLMRLFKGNYAAFSFAVPVADRIPEDFHRLSVSYEKDTNHVTWSIDGKDVLTVERPGCLIDRKYMCIDQGGKEQEVRISRMTGGLGFYALMDGSLGEGVNLVNLSGGKGCFDPQIGEPKPAVYIDNESKKESRLFGQGAQLYCKEFSVYYSG